MRMQGFAITAALCLRGFASMPLVTHSVDCCFLSLRCALTPRPPTASWRSAKRSCSSSVESSVSHSSPVPTTLAGHLLLALDHRVDLLFQRARADELMHLHVLLLPDAKGAVGRLVLHGRVPPAVEVEDVVGGRQVQAHAARLQREQEEGRLRRLRSGSAPPSGRAAPSARRHAGTALPAERLLQVLAEDARPSRRTA